MLEPNLAHCTAVIVGGYCSHNSIETADIPELISLVHRSLVRLDAPAQPMPAVPIDQSVTPEFLICLEDGKQLKMLKRYLEAHYHLTPEQYREKWGLPDSYPMSAPNYSRKRSDLAKNIGLGVRGAKP